MVKPWQPLTTIVTFKISLTAGGEVENVPVLEGGGGYLENRSLF